ncbi:MAG: PIN domain-containing protein [Acidobacteriota bacterium]
MGLKYILDTHALIWYLEGNLRLGAAAKAAMDDPISDLILPIIALAEAVDIVDKGRTGITDVSVLLDRVLNDPRIEIHPLTFDVLKHSLAATAVPEMHDRLIVATALFLQSLGHQTALLTKDNQILASALVPVVW